MIRVEHFSFCDLLLKTHPNIAAFHISLLLSAWLVHSLSHSIIQQNYIEHLPVSSPSLGAENARWISHLLTLLFFSLQTRSFSFLTLQKKAEFLHLYLHLVPCNMLFGLKFVKRNWPLFMWLWGWKREEYLNSHFILLWIFFFYNIPQLDKW